jgi:hypothetical protein
LEIGHLLKQLCRRGATAALLAATSQEQDIRDINQEMADNGSANDLNDKDYSDKSDIATLEI